MVASGSELKISVREATNSDHAEITRLYERCGYRHGIKASDLAIVAIKEDVLVGTVRLCREHDTLVLRGMQVLSEIERQGVGSLLLKACVQRIGGSTCYCVPYVHLEGFYEREEFSRIEPEGAPGFLAERYRTYLADGSDVILMFRQSI